jgi:hypothetical protein
MAAETYIPGEHDPVQHGMQAQPQAAPAPSSLDSLPQRRPRGRAEASA